ncbi:MAG: hypothetical protein AB8I08_07865 [Sandaracinaceae bacterium]
MLWLVVAVLGVLAPTGARAQVSERARQAVADAQALYEANRFEEAGAAFEAAYDVTAHPSMIYNAYVAYRDAGLPREALRTLRRHLALIAERDPERPRLEARLQGLEQQVSASPEPDIVSVQPDPVPPEPQPDSGDATLAPAVVLAAGGVVLVTGAILAGVTAAEHESFVELCTGSCPELADDAASGQALALASDILLAVGGAVAVAGLIWLVVEAASGSDGSGSAFRCRASGCGGTF